MYRILVVDDDESNLMAIQRLFHQVSAYEVLCSNNGYDAVRLAKNFIPDVILLDVKMPEMDGYEVCREIKVNPETENCMVLMLSGLYGVSDRLKGYEVLADDFISKPVDSKELMAKVRILLRLKNALDDSRKLNQQLEKLVEKQTRDLVMKSGQAMVGLTGC